MPQEFALRFQSQIFHVSPLVLMCLILIFATSTTTLSFTISSSSVRDPSCRGHPGIGLTGAVPRIFTCLQATADIFLSIEFFGHFDAGLGMLAEKPGRIPYWP
jgi:hypothetical protein